MQSVILAPFTARDGENLALYDWHPERHGHDTCPSEAHSRGVVLIVHGLGEHASRHQRVARKLQDWGFAVRAYDQRGHGESGGARGALPTDAALLDDLAEMVDDTRLRFAGLPLILLGHSMGGLVASRFVALKIRPVEALVMSSPALDAGLNVFQKLLLAAMLRLAPNWCLNNGLNARYISHDAGVVKAYFADRLVHRKISPRLGQFIEAGGPATVAAAAQWSTPTLLLYAGADRLVNPAGSRTFVSNAAASAAVKPGMVTAHCFKNLYHEIFNEVDSNAVFEALNCWLNTWFITKKAATA